MSQPLPALVPLSQVCRPVAVVFVDQGAGFWLRPLKPGYRHCFVALRQQPGLWLICDPLKDRIEISAVEVERDVELADIYRAAGHRVWLGTSLPRAARPRASVPGPLTCVAVVKRLIGLGAPWVVTPFQLHRHLLAIGAAPCSCPVIGINA
ncbi:MAG TPA: hypothetical protein VFZ01_11635 [Geminicoccaceae bacterium]